MAAVAGRIADSGGNIDRIERMARYPVTAIDLHVSGIDTDTLRTMLAAEAARQGIDVAVQPANLQRRGMRLIVMDVDSTLIQGEVIEMLAEHAGYGNEVAEVTEAAMRGDLDFEESLRERVKLLEGVPESGVRRRVRRDRAHPGRPDPRPDPAPARLPLRARLRWLQPDHRAARRRPRHPLLPGQRARGRRRQAHRPDRGRRGRPRRQGAGAARVRRRARPRARRR